jgi:hypothetical protein
MTETINDPIFDMCRAEDRVLVHAVVGVGLWRGRVITSAVERAAMHRDIADIRGLNRAERRRLLGLVAHDVRARLVSPNIVDLAPDNDADLMDDLGLLMCCQMVCGDAALTGSGVVQISVAIDPEYAETWRDGENWRRAGMLDPAVVEPTFVSDDAHEAALRAARAGPLAAAGVRSAAA